MSGDPYPNHPESKMVDDYKAYRQMELLENGDVPRSLMEPAILTVHKPGGLVLGFHDVEIKYVDFSSYHPPFPDETMVRVDEETLAPGLIL